MKRIAVLVSGCLLFLAAVGVDAQETTIAVLDLETQEGVPESYRGPLSDMVRTALFNTRRFRVMERNKMEEILKEQAFQLLDCTSDECAVEMGRLLGVQQMVAGSVSKLGETHTITLRLIDVETGEVLAAEMTSCRCTIDEVISTSIITAARRVAGLDGGTIRPTRPDGSYSGRTVPEGTKSEDPLPGMTFVQRPAGKLSAKGVKVGVNMANMSGDDTDFPGMDKKSIIGFAFGGFCEYSFNESFAVQPEVLYTMKGAKWEDTDATFTATYNYVQIPILAKYIIVVNGAVSPYILVGPAIGINVTAESESDFAGVTETETDDDATMTFGLVVGAGGSMEMGNGALLFELRYDMGLNNVSDPADVDEFDVKNSVIQFVFGYAF